MTPPPSASVIARLRELGSELDRLDDVAAQLYGLNRTDMRALEIIGRSAPIAPSELARRLGFTTGGITTVIDRLERAGFARRRPDRTDRRRLLVTTTEATRIHDRQVFGPLMHAITTLLQPYSPDEVRLITTFLHEVQGVVADYADALAGRGD
jgi:DNA-binding MarR family transcriptional regulator